MEGRPAIWRVAANMLNKQSRNSDKEWFYSLVFGRGDNNSLHKTAIVTKIGVLD